VQNLALSFEVLDRARDILDRHLGIDPVLIEKVDAVGPKPFQRTFDSLPDVRRLTVQPGT
jgi:hypothetical protein